MKQFAMTAAAAAAVMMMNPAFAADAAYEADLCVIGAGASGTAAAWAAAEKGMKVITLEKSGITVTGEAMRAWSGPSLTAPPTRLTG